VLRIHFRRGQELFQSLLITLLFVKRISAIQMSCGRTSRYRQAGSRHYLAGFRCRELPPQFVVTRRLGSNLFADHVQLGVEFDGFLIELRRLLSQRFRLRMKLEDKLSAVSAREIAKRWCLMR